MFIIPLKFRLNKNNMLLFNKRSFGGIFIMSKRKKWSYEFKVKCVEMLIEGRSYSSICDEYNISSSGMVANWKRDYLSGKLSKNEKIGRPVVSNADEYEILKKCYAQLMKIRSK